jgi:hypothetical protein
MLYPPDTTVNWNFGNDTSKYIVTPPITITPNAKFDSLKTGTNWTYIHVTLTGNPDDSRSSEEFATVTLASVSDSQFNFVLTKSNGTSSFSLNRNDTSFSDQYSNFFSRIWSNDTNYRIIKLDSNGSYQHVFISGIETNEIILSSKYGTLYKNYDNNDYYDRHTDWIKLIKYNDDTVHYLQILKEIAAKDTFLSQNSTNIVIQ